MKKLKLDRKSVKFDYEFLDGTTVQAEYFESTTAQIDHMMESMSHKERADYMRVVLHENLRGAMDGAADKIIAEQETHGNLYDFKVTLDEELGKLKKSA